MSRNRLYYFDFWRLRPTLQFCLYAQKPSKRFPAIPLRRAQKGAKGWVAWPGRAVGAPSIRSGSQHNRTVKAISRRMARSRCRSSPAWRIEKPDSSYPACKAEQASVAAKGRQTETRLHRLARTSPAPGFNDWTRGRDVAVIGRRKTASRKFEHDFRPSTQEAVSKTIATAEISRRYRWPLRPSLRYPNRRALPPIQACHHFKMGANKQCATGICCHCQFIGRRA